MSAKYVFTWRNKANCERLVEDIDVRFYSEQSLNKTDLGNADGEADEEGKAGSEDEDISNHL